MPMKIKLRLPTNSSSSDDSPSAVPVSLPEDTSTAAPLVQATTTAQQPHALAQSHRQEAEGDEEGSGDEEVEGDGDVSMANSNAGDSEDELASPEVSRASISSSDIKPTGTAASLKTGPSASSGKRKPTRRERDDAATMTVEEIDALPAAKRRRTHKAKGALGPGRNWRKGLRGGQKPLYELPDGTIASGEGPFPDGAHDEEDHSSRASPSSALSISPEPINKIVAAAAAVNKVKATSPPLPTATTTVASAGPAFLPAGARPSSVTATPTATPATSTFAQPTTSAIVKTDYSRPFFFLTRPTQAVGAAVSHGPPVKPPPRLLISGPALTPNNPTGNVVLNTDGNQKPRRWIQDERQFVNLGGRIIKVKTWWSGEEGSFQPEVEREKEEAALVKKKAEQAQARLQSLQQAGGGDASTTAGDESLASSPKPSGSRTSTPNPSSATAKAGGQVGSTAGGESGRGTPPKRGASRNRGGSTKGSGRGGAVTPRAPSFYTPPATGEAPAAKTASKDQGTTAPVASSPTAGVPSHLPKPKFAPGGGGGVNWKGGVGK